MRIIVPIERTFRNLLSRFSAVRNRNWDFRRILELWQRINCLVSCRGEIVTVSVNAKIIEAQFTAGWIGGNYTDSGGTHDSSEIIFDPSIAPGEHYIVELTITGVTGVAHLRIFDEEGFTTLVQTVTGVLLGVVNTVIGTIVFPSYVIVDGVQSNIEITSSEAFNLPLVTHLRGADPFSKKTVIFNDGDYPATIYESGRIVEVVPALESKELKTTGRFILDARPASGFLSSLSVTTFRRCDCGDAHIPAPDQDLTLTDGDLI